jgi:hypothetical protein
MICLLLSACAVNVDVDDARMDRSSKLKKFPVACVVFVKFEDIGVKSL